MRKEQITSPDLVTHRRQLTGIVDVVSAAKTVLGADSDFQRNCSSMEPESFNWTQTESLEEAVTLCELGWPEGLAMAESKILELDLDSPGNLGFMLEQQFSTSGDEPDVDRFLSGEPENMVEYSLDQNRTGRNVRVLFNIAQSAGVESDTIMRRGIVVAAALGNITTAGYGIDLDLVERVGPSYSVMSDQVVEYSIPLTEAGDYFNLDSLIFGLVHPSMLRRLIFAMNECEDEELRRDFGFGSYGGYGMPLSIPKEEHPGTVVIDKQHYLVGSDEQIPEAVESLTKEILILAARR